MYQLGDLVSLVDETVGFRYFAIFSALWTERLTRWNGGAFVRPCCRGIHPYEGVVIS